MKIGKGEKIKMLRQTTNAKVGTIKRNWYVVDAADLPLGRLASEVAMVLMGKKQT